MTAPRSSPGSLLIRADASPEIGTGHVMRCLALAQAWQDQGGSVIFLMARTTSAITERLKKEGCTIESLLGNSNDSEDAAYTAEVGRCHGTRWIVLDGYRFDPDYQHAVKDSGFRLLSLDDLGGGHAYFADLILNQNIHAAGSMYANRQSYSRCLLGPRFALLRREFRNVRDRIQKTEAHRVLITMGGADPGNATARVLEALRAMPERLEVKVVVGPANSSVENPAWTSSRAHQVQIINNPDSMAELMTWADLAVSAAGSTVWEMCRLGLPAILVSIADNQVPGAEELGRKGTTIYLGSAKNIRNVDIKSALMELLCSPERRTEMSRAGQRLVDGRGAERVVATLQTSPLRIRRATQQDCGLLWQWVNDPQVRAASFNSRAISREDHAAWFTCRLNSADAAIYIAEDASGLPVGQFRVELERPTSAIVDVSVVPGRRGVGIGVQLIAEATQRVFRDMQLQKVNAYIKPGNHSSLRAFESAGFSGFQLRGTSIHCYMEREGQSA